MGARRDFYLGPAEKNEKKGGQNGLINAWGRRGYYYNPFHPPPPPPHPPEAVKVV